MRFMYLAALAVLSASPAVAADLPTHKAPAPPPVVVPAFTWTGCYAGLHLGGDFGNVSAGAPVNVSGSDSGVIGGGQIGCNYQIQSFVIGAEGELWGSSLNGSATVGGGAGVAPLPALNFTARSDFAGDLALRAGFAFDRALIFGKVGGAWAEYQFSASGPGGNTSANSTFTGLLVGGGVEYAFDAHWSLKGEYDYIYYNSNNVTFSGAGGAGSVNIRPTENIVKVGANYRF
jgi:outer membrane immunogenic protein